ncbi:MAG: hypothetical protein ACLT5P_15270 [Flavonifractor plautii]
MFLTPHCVQRLYGFRPGQAGSDAALLLPVADLVGLTRQTVILAFNFGDGFGNYLPHLYRADGLIGAASILMTAGCASSERSSWSGS